MKVMNTVLVPLSLLILLSATGCGGRSNHPKYTPKLGWVEFGRGSGDTYYVVTDKQCDAFSNYGFLNSNALGGFSISNVLPEGTQLFTIKGVDPKKAIAVYEDGHYFEADYYGSDEPH